MASIDWSHGLCATDTGSLTWTEGKPSRIHLDAMSLAIAIHSYYRDRI